MFYTIAIAITGAIVLGVEVLSSRILTPYFGVSLYIWASILSITLLGLAGGYFLGGVVAKRSTPDRLRVTFLLYLSIASTALALSAALYPRIFPALMNLHLVVGSLLAAIILMAAPLLLFSALNSFVIVLTKTGENANGDAGAGRVFFVSTLGSVAGVVLTAFLVIPLFSNTKGLLLFSLATALVACAGSWICLSGIRAHLNSWIFAVVAVALSAGLLVQEYVFPADQFAGPDGRRWTILDERHSIFGSIKVAEVGMGADTYRFYINDGIIQDAVQVGDGRSVVLFPHMLSALLSQYAPDAKNILFLGLAAGLVPMDFPPPRYHADIVEINPDSLDIAKRYFGFSEDGRVTHIQDARTFVRDCKGRFDAIVFDMFHGDGVPDYLLSKEFFRSLQQCGTENAVIVMNAFEDRDHPEVRNAILATVHAAFANMAYFSDPSDKERVRNVFLVASNQELRATPAQYTAPAYLARQLEATLAGRETFTRQSPDLEAPLSDAHNVYSVLSSDMSMRVRKSIQTHMATGLFKS